MYNKDLLKYYMSLANKDRKECADALGMSYNTFCSYYNGKKEWTLGHIRTLCDYLGIVNVDVKCAIFLS